MITQRERDKLRARLEAAGMPEVYAYMAAQYMGINVSRIAEERLVQCGFIWRDAPEGAEFWSAINEEYRRNLSVTGDW